MSVPHKSRLSLIYNSIQIIFKSFSKNYGENFIVIVKEFDGSPVV